MGHIGGLFSRCFLDGLNLCVKVGLVNMKTAFFAEAGEGLYANGVFAVGFHQYGI